MPISERVYPMNEKPGKYQIEMMYQVAALSDPAFVQPTDFAEFGIDRAEWQNKRQIHMGKDGVSTEKLRGRVGGLWARMSTEQRLLFWMTYANTAAVYISGIASMIEEELDVELPVMAEFMMKFQLAAVKAGAQTIA